MIKLGTDIKDLKLGSTQIQKVMLGDKLVWQKAAAVDADAVAFINAAGLTDQVHKDAINYLVKELKQNNLWDKFYKIYPVIGTTSQSLSRNLKNPSINDIDPLAANTGQSYFNFSRRYLYKNLNGPHSNNNWCWHNLWIRNFGAPEGFFESFPNLWIRSWGVFQARVFSSTQVSINLNMDANSMTAVQILNNTLTTFNSGAMATNINNYIVDQPMIDNFYMYNMESRFMAFSAALTPAEHSTFYNIVKNYKALLGETVI